MTDKGTQTQDKFVLRLPDGMRDRIKAKADANGRSMNAEIIRLLEREYPAPSDVMHIHLGNIRRVLDLYEQATDPKERMRLQALVEAMTTMGHNIEVGFDEDGNV